MTNVRFVSLLVVALVASGCGVQSGGHKTAAPDCGAIKSMTGLKASMDAQDLKIQNNRPSTVTLESIRRLAPFYRDAASTFDGLLQRAKTGLAEARSAGRPTDLVGAWSLMVESLRLRRDGIQFYALAFAHPENLNHSILAKDQTYLHRTERLNSRLKSSIIRVLTNQGFKARPDGQFVIDC